jgi:hypothetical protein
MSRLDRVVALLLGIVRGRDGKDTFLPSPVVAHLLRSWPWRRPLRASVRCRLGSYARTAKMVDLTTLAEAVTRDPLLGAFVLMATGALVSRLLFKQQPIWRAIVRVVFLILLTLLFLHNGIVPYEPLHSTGTPFHDVIVGTLYAYRVG